MYDIELRNIHVLPWARVRLTRVQQVKNFGFAGYSLGLAKDDSTDKRLDVCQYVLERVQ